MNKEYKKRAETLAFLASVLVVSLILYAVGWFEVYKLGGQAKVLQLVVCVAATHSVASLLLLWLRAAEKEKTE